MTLMLQCTRIFLIPLLAAIWVTGSAAASLGRINVHSALGESFRADIDLQNLGPDEASSVQVKLASPDTYRKNGVEFNSGLLGIRATLSNDSRSPMIVLRSASGVNEPVLDLLIELSSDKGSLVKKYTVLLDPPAQKSPDSEAAFAPTLPRISSTPLGTQSTTGSSYLSLKPSLSLKTDREAVFSPSPKKPTRLSKRLEKRLKKQLELEAKREAKRKAKREAQLVNPRDTLSVVAPSSTKDVLKDDSPQALAKRLVKSGITDAAQIEALINALSIAKLAALAKESPQQASSQANVASAVPSNPSSNAAGAVVSVLNLPVFAQVPQTLPAVSSTPLPAVTANVPMPSSSAQKASADDWLEGVWPWLALCLAGLLAALAWLFYDKRKQAQALNDNEEHYPLTQFDTLHAPDLSKDAPKTVFYETAFFNEIDTQKTQINQSPAKNIASVDQPIFESTGNNAAVMLNELLEENPRDNTVRIMLMSMLCDQQNVDGFNLHLAQLKIHTQASGAQWEEGLALQTALMQQKNDALNSALHPPTAQRAEEQTLEFSNSPMLSLDLSNPTVFSPAAGAVTKSLPTKTTAKQKSTVVEFADAPESNAINTASSPRKSPQQEITLSPIDTEIKPVNAPKKKPT